MSSTSSTPSIPSVRTVAVFTYEGDELKRKTTCKCCNCYHYGFPCGNCVSDNYQSTTMDYPEFRRCAASGANYPRDYNEYLKEYSSGYDSSGYGSSTVEKPSLKRLRPDEN